MTEHRILWPVFSRISHFSSVSHFYISWKRLTFSEGIEMWHWTKMVYYTGKCGSEKTHILAYLTQWRVFQRRTEEKVFGSYVQLWGIWYLESFSLLLLLVVRNAKKEVHCKCFPKNDDINVFHHQKETEHNFRQYRTFSRRHVPVIWRHTKVVE